MKRSVFSVIVCFCLCSIATTAAAQTTPDCKTNRDGSKTCGFNCRLGANGFNYCSSAPDGKCALQSDGTYTCTPADEKSTPIIGADTAPPATPPVDPAPTTPVEAQPTTPVETAPADPVKPEPTPVPESKSEPKVEPETTKPMIVTDSMAKDLAKEAGESNFDWSVRVKSEGIAAENRDMRETTEDTFIDRIDSDDRFTTFYTSARLDSEYKFTNELSAELDLGLRLVWGGAGTGLVPYAANVKWQAYDSDALAISTRIGAQHFEIGGAKNDFFYKGSIAGVTIDIDAGKIGKLRLLPIDIASVADPDNDSIADFSRTNIFLAENFRGDTFTYRGGAVYENTKILDGLQARAFAFVADIGAGKAPHTGADRAIGGAIGNFSDNDYAWMGGLRLGYLLETDMLDLNIYGEFARSGGIDRKEVQVGVRDVTANGNAFGAAVQPTLKMKDFKLAGNLQLFLAEGAQYTGNEGLLFNYGFVGFGGSKIGGGALAKGASWRPSTYLSNQGFYSTPHDQFRSSGTMAINAAINPELFDKFGLHLGIWFLLDTSKTNFEDFDNVDETSDELPFGYTAADILAQERLGETLGIELDGKLTIKPVENFAIFAAGSIFLPGKFYEIEISRTGGSEFNDLTALGAATPASFWTAGGGAELTF